MKSKTRPRPEDMPRFEEILEPIMHKLATAKALGAAVNIDAEDVGFVRRTLQDAIDAGQYALDAVIEADFRRYQIVVIGVEGMAVLQCAMCWIAWVYAWIVLKVVL